LKFASALSNKSLLKAEKDRAAKAEVALRKAADALKVRSMFALLHF
jgi:hypothetical protein